METIIWSLRERIAAAQRMVVSMVYSNGLSSDQAKVGISSQDSLADYGHMSHFRRINHLFCNSGKRRFHFLHMLLYKTQNHIITHLLEILSHRFFSGPSWEKPLCDICPRLFPRISTRCFAIQFLVED